MLKISVQLCMFIINIVRNNINEASEHYYGKKASCA